MIDLIIYKKPVNKTIDEAWTKIFKLTKRLCVIQLNLKMLTTSKKRFATLLRSLSDEYNNVRDVINAQNNADVNIAIQKLQEKEAQLKTKKTKTKKNDMWTKRKNKRIKKEHHKDFEPRRHRSLSLSTNEENKDQNQRWHVMNESKKKCYVCEKKHRVVKCEFYDELKALKTKFQARIKDIVKKEKRSFVKRAYNGDSDNESDNVSNAADDSNDEKNEKEEEEIAALFKKMVSKISKSKWIADTDASFHMIDQFQFFRGPLIPTKKRTIKVEKRKLYSNQRESVMMRMINEQSMLTGVLYVPNLGVNLLSKKKLCVNELKKNFDESGLYLHDIKGKQVLKASDRKGLYIVNKITFQLSEYVLIASNISKIIAMPTLTDPTDVEMTINSFAVSDHFDLPSRASKLKMYRLWHRRFVHLESAKLRNLHKITTLKKAISIVEDQDFCEICALTKMINKQNHQCFEQKAKILNLVFINICEELPLFKKKHQYFLKIVNNHSRRIWFIFLHKRADAVAVLRKWKLEMKLQSETFLQIVRSDNVKELKSVLNEWCESIEIIFQYTVAYNSIQNDVIKRGIRTTENQIRAMIKNAELPIKFWPKTQKTNIYIRNRIATDSTVDGNFITFMKTFIGVKSFIDHIRVWDCKCYAFVNPKSLTEDRKDKFMNRNKLCVFLKYVKKTDIQYLMWTSNRGFIKHHKVVFAEDQKWKNKKLNLLIKTENVFSVKQSMDQSSKTMSALNAITAAVKKPIKRTNKKNLHTTKLDVAVDPASVDEFNFDKAISSDNQQLGQTKNDILEWKSGSKTTSTIEKFSHIAIPPPVILSSDRSTSAKNVIKEHHNDNSRDGNHSSKKKTTAKSKKEETIKPQQFLHMTISKRKREDSDNDIIEHRQKIIKVMLALLTENKKNSDDKNQFDTWTFMTRANVKNQFVDRFVISVPETYQEVIKNPTWKTQWRKTIQTELTILITNEILKSVTPSKNVNIVISK